MLYAGAKYDQGEYGNPFNEKLGWHVAAATRQRHNMNKLRHFSHTCGRRREKKKTDFLFTMTIWISYAGRAEGRLVVGDFASFIVNFPA